MPVDSALLRERILMLIVIPPLIGRWMMRLLVPSAFAGLLLSPQPAMARMSFAPHSGASLILHGNGGTNSENHGIDVWTDGMPNCSFQVIGTIGDVRTDKLLAGRAGQSAAIAKLVRKMGGDAALVRRISKETVGYLPGPTSGYLGSAGLSDQRKAPVNQVTTVLAVIKYM